ncbi:LuxR C-terminal-related transcriptional regulator [Sphingobacterium prati]|uniref:LuxR C-terminal-related transcriptional regulator n=1 Tax=Sphingobacterium prati TaxID=2737006 RepID=UPI001557D3DD|nr:response regulator transcription factor [Sphingobacterium prati]NPE46660.1 response regulator transcription factor [Sphingobacterium prati]
MITVGIIDSNEQARQITLGVLQEKGPMHKVKVLFEMGKERIDQAAVAPDVIIMDIEHQEPLIVEHVKTIFPNTDIVILTNICDVKTVRACFRHGAVGYLLKQTCMNSLLSAISITLNDGSFVSPGVNRALIDQSFSSKKYVDMLTARELQVANGIIEGLSYKMIAQKYTISLDTVRIYIKRIYRKLQINSKGELIAQLTA